MSLIPSQVQGVITELADLLSSGDTDYQTPPIVAVSDATDPLAGKPMYASPVAAENELIMNVKPAGGLEGAYSTVRNVVSSAATSVASGVSSLVSKVTGSGSPAAKAASAPAASSSWMLWVLLAGGAAAVFFAVKPAKGKKSFLGKLGGKSGIKL